MPSKRDAMTARALALVGCGYIYGATGWICTRARMEQQMRQYPTYAGQIERYGKKWLGKPCYDCAQLTRDVARRAGVRLPSGATSQWRAAGIWKEKDVIDTLPDEAGLFLYTMRDGRMTHTGVSIGRGEEVDARGHAYGVVRRPISGTSFTHWARLNIDYDAPDTAENPTPARIRFNETDVRSTGRVSMGVRGMNLTDNDVVIGMQTASQGTDLLIVSEKGMGKRTNMDEFTRQNRGGKGVKCYKITEKTGNVVGMKAVDEDSEIMIINTEGIIIRMKCSDISIYGRITSGVKLINLKEKDKVASVAKVRKASAEIDGEQVEISDGEEPESEASDNLEES